MLLAEDSIPAVFENVKLLEFLEKRKVLGGNYIFRVITTAVNFYDSHVLQSRKKGKFVEPLLPLFSTNKEKRRRYFFVKD